MVVRVWAFVFAIRFFFSAFFSWAYVVADQLSSLTRPPQEEEALRVLKRKRK